MIVRTDPDEHRIALLSIPRDLRVEIPGTWPRQGQRGVRATAGPTLAIRTVQALTGHPAQPRRRRQLLQVQGRDRHARRRHDRRPEADPLEQVRLPVRHAGRVRPLAGLALPQGRARDERPPGADLRARPRSTSSTPRDNDITRGERQQAVVQAMADEITSFGTFLRMPFIGDELVAPLATDLSANQFLQLGWVKRRTPSSGLLRCRLGGHDRRHRRAVVHHRERGQRRRSSRWSRARRRRSRRARGTGSFGPGCRVGPARVASRRYARLDAGLGGLRLGLRRASCPASSRPSRRRRRRPWRPDAGSRGRSRSSRSPEPLKWIAAGYSTFVTGPSPQTSHTSGGGSVMRWNTSKVWPLGQRYS